MIEPAARPAPARSAGRRIVESGEFDMNSADFAAIAEILMREAGISLGEGKANLVYSRLAKRLRILGFKSFAQYVALVRKPEGEDERQAMIAALTTNVTRFFREPHHFEHLKTQMMPGIMAQAKAGRPVRFWSAASSSGQEAYSMALTVLSVFPEVINYNFRILATDIDPNVLAIGEAGLYDATLLEPVPPALRQRWFQAAPGGQCQAAPELRAMVKFRKLNLIGHWPMRGPFHAIFCRNVVIYFDNPTQEKIWSRMLPLLDQQGALYIGHSERVSGAADGRLRSDGITIYRPAPAQGGLA